MPWSSSPLIEQSGHPYADLQSTVFAGGEFKHSVVQLHNLSRNREANAGAGLVKPGAALQNSASFGGRYSWPVVTDNNQARLRNQRHLRIRVTAGISMEESLR